MVNITVLRRFLRGKTHKRSRVETRGRKRTLSRRNVLTGSSRSGANIARMGYGAVSTWSAWYRWASCPDARTMLMVLCIRLVFASACTHRVRQTHSAGWLKLLVPTCPVQFGTKSFQPFPNHVICVSVHVLLELSSCSAGRWPELTWRAAPHTVHYYLRRTTSPCGVLSR